MKPSELRDTIEASLLAAALPGQLRLEVLLAKWCHKVAEEFIDRFSEAEIKDFRFECLMERNVAMRTALEFVKKDLESFRETGVTPSLQSFIEWLGAIDAALNPAAKGGES